MGEQMARSVSIMALRSQNRISFEIESVAVLLAVFTLYDFGDDTWNENRIYNWVKMS